MAVSILKQPSIIDLSKQLQHLVDQLLRLPEKPIFRISRPELFFEKGVLKNFPKITGKHLCWSLDFNQVAGLQLATLLKKRLPHRFCPVNLKNFAKILKNTYFVKRLRMTASGCCQANINLDKSLPASDLLLIHS